MLTKLTPEGFDIANAYLEHGSVEEVARVMMVPVHEVVQTLNRKDVKDYVNGVYMDLGYRNRHKLGALLDKMIESKIQEAEETGIYTGKDLFELIQFAHKMRMDEIKAEQKIDNSTNVQIANIGGSNYQNMMERLMAPKRLKDGD